MPDFNKLTISEIARRLNTVDDTYKRQYSGACHLVKTWFSLTIPQMEIAKYGLERHFYYCDKYDVSYDVHAIIEIISEARQGLSTAKEMQILLDKRKGTSNSLRNYDNFYNSFSNGKKKGKMPVS